MTCLMAVGAKIHFYGGPGNDLIYADKADDVINGWLPVHDPNDPDNTAPLEDS